MESVRAFLKQIATFWAGLSTLKRIALSGITFAVLLVFLLISYIGNRKNYAYLYTNLEPQDAAAIVEKLKTAQIPYRIEADGRAVLVPDERIAQLRLELASSGLPHGGGIGFELFDRSQLGATEFEQQVSLRRALEGELSRSILTIQGVQSARVHLVMPERRLFVTKESQPSASVVLKLSNAAAFGKRETAGIVHLVSAAVPGLHRDRVSVVSTDGVTLHRPNTGDSGLDSGSSDVSSERATAVASQLENAARSQLERIVGIGNAEVRIAVDLDTSARERVEEHYEPSKTALRSENRTEERNSTGALGSSGVSGVPGAMANLPDARQPDGQANEAGGTQEGSTARLSQTRNWEVDKVSQKTTTPPGEIERLSVSVLVNDKIEIRDGKPTPIARTPEEIAKLEELVKRAVGYSLERGDSLKVESAPFLRTDVQDGVKGPSNPPWRRYLPHLFAAAGSIAVLVLILALRKRRTKAKAAALAQLSTSSTLGQLPLADGSLPESLPGEVSTAQLPGSQQLDAPIRRARAIQMANDDPATAAIVIRKWLNAPNGATAPARI